jgi:hypothetical protein
MPGLARGMQTCLKSERIAAVMVGRVPVAGKRPLGGKSMPRPTRPFSYAAALALTVALAMLPLDAGAAASKDPDWPCIQVKVPHVSAGMVWAGPAIDEANRAWEAAPDVAPLVGKLAQRRLDVADAPPLIEAFAKQHAADKQRQLTLLFNGLLQTINQERDAIIRGIARYARQQAVRADGIRTARDELTALNVKDSLTDNEKARRTALEDQLNWETRIYDERAQSLTYVCDSPRILEQRLFSLSRAIQQHLD